MWNCPACLTQLRHASEERPSKGQQYRCHVCRLELVMRDDESGLEIAPFEQDHLVEPSSERTSRTLPLPAEPPKKSRNPRRRRS